MKEQAPAYIPQIKRLVKTKQMYPLKDLFMALRKDFPEVENMRTLRSNIEKYIDDVSVNQNNMIVSKTTFLDDILSIIK